jgi:hypothetical protein
MTQEMTANSEATAVASGLMVAALADILIEKGILSRGDVTGALKKAFDQISDMGQQPIRIHGPQVIASVMASLSKGR